MSKIEKWLESIGWGDWSMEVVSSDASFRSYYRLHKDEESYILMDSSLLLESIPSFVDIQGRLKEKKVQVPNIIVKNIKIGYLILEDFGSAHYLDNLNEKNYKKLYKKAIDEIVKMQQVDTEYLPVYNKDFLIFEMKLLKEWYFDKYLQKTIKFPEKTMIEKTMQDIARIVLEQPQDVFVHRDYHSRNIMLTSKNDIGIIDFQDARVGAITYDLVSLLKDCYVEWDTKEVEKLALYYRDVSELEVDDSTFIRWFDFMGLQRHLKVLGIFARLYLRDNKKDYLKDIPLTLSYVVKTAKKYPETQKLAELLRDHKEKR